MTAAMEAPGQAAGRAEARRAAFTLVGSAALFAVMAAMVKVASRRIPAPQTALIRFLIGIAAVGVVFALRRVSLRPTRPGWLVARGVFGGLAVLAYFSCIAHLPVGVATLLNFTAPVFTMLFSWALLGERPHRSVLGGLALTLAGVFLVLRSLAGVVHAGWWELVGILSAVGSGIAVTSIRATRRQVKNGPPLEGAWTVFFSFTVFGTLVNLPAVLPPLGHWVAPTSAEWRWLLAMGIVGVAAQMLMTTALRHVTAATSGIIHQLTVVFAMAIGIVLLGEPLTTFGLIGSALTVGGVALTVLASPALVGAAPGSP